MAGRGGGKGRMSREKGGEGKGEIGVVAELLMTLVQLELVHTRWIPSSGPVR
jgi:hypothetical protein